MKVLKMIVFSILYFIGTVLLAVVVVLTTSIAYSTLQFFLFSRGNYLLFVSSGLNMIPMIMIMISKL